MRGGGGGCGRERRPLVTRPDRGTSGALPAPPGDGSTPRSCGDNFWVSYRRGFGAYPRTILGFLKCAGGEEGTGKARGRPRESPRPAEEARSRREDEFVG